MSALKTILPQCNLCYQVSGRVVFGKIFGRYCSSLTKTVNEEEGTQTDKKLSKAMRAYLERSRKYNEFLKQEEQAFNIGKRHLANMMGCDPETFTQEQIDEAIAYLFPSGLFEKKARPFMKPPDAVFPAKKDAQFDETGRPFHYLFYTGKPNFYNILHESIDNMNRLNELQDKINRGKSSNEPSKPMNTYGSVWITKDDLERAIVEKLTDNEYNNFVQVMERLSSHDNASAVKDFIFNYRKPLMENLKKLAPTEPEIGEDGRKFILTTGCPRKSARADVKVIYPGTGLISINGQGIEYFSRMECRNQILFPLELSGLKGKVDVEASVSGGGYTGQAGAIRWGISWGLRCFVSPEVMESMRLAGLLTKDFRRRERKKPGQEGARRKFTWKKR